MFLQNQCVVARLTWAWASVSAASVLSVWNPAIKKMLFFVSFEEKLFIMCFGENGGQLFRATEHDKYDM